MPFWGYVADVIQSRKAVYILCKALATVSLLSLSWVHGFNSILGCVIGMAASQSSGVLDAHTLDFLGEKHRNMYGTIRIWSAISWGLGAVIMGGITDSFGFEWNFVLFGIMMATVLLVISFGLPARSCSEQARYDQLNHNDDDNNDEGESERPSIMTLIRAICRFPVVLWLLEVAVIGAAMSLVDAFLFVFLQNDLQASTTLCGYTVGVTVLFELPIFHYSKYLLKTWGHDLLFVFAMLAYSIRVIGYTLLTPSTVHWILLLEVLQGITFASMWIASIDFSARVAPAEWSTTFQSMLSMTMSCLGGGVGPILGGYAMDYYGPVPMYRTAGLIVGTVGLVHVALWLGLSRGHGAFLQRATSREDP
jgi:MFS family permease